MLETFEFLEQNFALLVKYFILLIEFISCFVLLFSVLRGMFELIKHKNTMRFNLAQGIAHSLEFKIAAELLHTVIVREWDEVLFLGGIIVLRALLAFLIQWEIKSEKADSFK